MEHQTNSEPTQKGVSSFKLPLQMGGAEWCVSNTNRLGFVTDKNYGTRNHIHCCFRGMWSICPGLLRVYTELLESQNRIFKLISTSLSKTEKDLNSLRIIILTTLVIIENDKYICMSGIFTDTWMHSLQKILTSLCQANKKQTNRQTKNKAKQNPPLIIFW